MPLCTLHLLSLNPTISIPTYLSLLRSHLPPNHQPITTARPIRWIITPTTIAPEILLDPLHPEAPNPPPNNGTVFDLLLIFPVSPSPLMGTKLLDKETVAANFELTIGIPSRILATYPSTNPSLLHPSPASTSTIPPLTNSLQAPSASKNLTASAQDLSLTPELRDWALSDYSQRPGRQGTGAVSMLNLLSFSPERGAHERYATYGKAFAESIGSRHGGTAKVVGRVISPPVSSSAQSSASSLSSAHSSANGKADAEDTEGEGQPVWEEVALAHYPSIIHFCEMLLDSEYQAVNQRYRVGSLRDTCILMCSELDPEVLCEDGRDGRGGGVGGGGVESGGGGGRGAKL